MNRPRNHYYLWIVLCLLLAPFCTFAQDSLPPSCIDISKIHYAQGISKFSQSAFIDKQTSLERALPTLNFKKGMVHTGTIPVKDVTRKSILRFTVCNSADSVLQIWFFPGFFYWDIKLYKQEGAGITQLPAVLPKVADNLGYGQLTVLPHDTLTIYAEMELVRTYINSMRPRLINTQRISTFIKDLQESHRDNNMVTLVFSGLLLMMILFSIANYFQGGSKEFLYYAGYAFFVGGMLFTKAMFDFRPNTMGYFFEGYFDFIMQSLGITFYMYFMRGFLDTKKQHPFLFHLYNFGIALLVLSMTLFSYFHFFTDNYAAENAVETITKFVLLAMTIMFLVYSIRKWNDRLLRFVFWGNFWLFIFSLISLLLSLFSNLLTLPGIWDSSLLYYEIGLFLELVFFLSGLNFKNRRAIIMQTKERERLKTENQLKEYEKELAVYKAQQAERQRISADMHDELGAGMTAIRLMSEIARNKMKETTPVEIERISQSADDVLNKMNAIIWSMNSGNDTLDNMVSYIRVYAIEYLESTAVECKIFTPEEIPATEITGDKRRNIFLCVKETLNNALKHSAATEISIVFEINSHLKIIIADNGVGIDLQKLRQFGNGLKNISRRMESIGGSYTIENKNGTVTTLTLPL